MNIIPSSWFNYIVRGTITLIGAPPTTLPEGRKSQRTSPKQTIFGVFLFIMGREIKLIRNK